MDHFIRIQNRYIPLHTITHIDDDGEHVLIAVDGAKTGPGEFRMRGEEASRLRDWLAQHTPLQLASQNEPQDTGYRDDD